MKTESNLERVLEAGQFAVTAEVSPPKSADAEVIRGKARMIKGCADAFNVTEGQMATVRMASWASCLLLLEEGLEPVVQMTCRDRNRIALQMDVLGIAALGINNILCLSGDPISLGNQPEAKEVYDLDSFQLVKLVRDMRDERKFQSREEMKVEPRLFIGAAANPFAPPLDYRPHRLAKKVDAGADFIQTQIMFNVPKFREYMKRVRELGLHERVHILAGVSPIKSYGAARYMATQVPGIDMPDEILERMERAPRDKEEGIKICTEIIRQVREIPGVKGVHIMAIGWEEAVPRVVEQAGLLPRPK
ncbi:MAG: methylenetetrahydrofolate reductase [Chloroflexota bacterium]|nr:methylenetetrahydrofolate reductase [Chloroflexota bacterium]